VSYTRGWQRLAWFGLSAVVALAASGLTPTAVHAAPKIAAPHLTLRAPDMGVSSNAAGFTALSLHNDVEETVTVDDVKVVVDTSGVDSFASVLPYNSPSLPVCTGSSPAPLTCTAESVQVWGKHYGGGLGAYSVSVSNSVPVGTTGTIKVTVTAKDLPTMVVNQKITASEPVDLAATPDGQTKVEAAPGATPQLPLAVRNIGDHPAHGAVLTFQRGYELAYAKRYSNCVYTDWTARCRFDTVLSRGTDYELSDRLVSVHGDATAPGSTQLYASWNTPDDVDDEDAYDDPFDGVPPVPGTDGALRLVPRMAANRANQTDPNRMNDSVWIAVSITGDSRPDPAAVGATVRGGVGSTVVAKLGIRNAGTARVAWNPYITVEVPDGTTVTSVSPAGTNPPGTAPVKRCVAYDPADEDGPDWDGPARPGARQYLCAPGGLAAHEQFTWDFTLRIDRGGPLKGTVRVNGTDDEGRGDPTNDVADILVNPPPGAGTGGTGGGTGTGPQAGGSLPITGANAGLFAGAGGLLVALGVGGFLLARRRRTRFVA
jgi:LPXTG-motif cell wall-anchored protein